MKSKTINFGKLGEEGGEVKKRKVIDWIFSGQYRMLDNFYMHPMTVDGIQAASVEHFYQAAKAVYTDTYLAILRAPTPGDAKMLGRTCEMRPEWNVAIPDHPLKFLYKDMVMWKYIDHKFNNLVPGALLRSTGDAIIIEGNTWGDDYWGQIEKGGVMQGKNMLGKMLMMKRDLLVGRTPPLSMDMYMI